MNVGRLEDLLGVMTKQNALLLDEYRLLREQLTDQDAGNRKRESAHTTFRFDTATTNREEVFDCVRAFGGHPALTLQFVDLGGGNLQIQFPDDPAWIGVVLGDVYRNETVTTFKLRATTGAAGTARVRVGAYVGV